MLGTVQNRGGICSIFFADARHIDREVDDTYRVGS
jgi:hypothetical protein